MVVRVLRPADGLHAFGGEAERLGLEMLRIDGGDDPATPREIVLADDARTTTARLVQDGYLEVDYVVLTGPAADAFAAALDAAGLTFDADEVLADVLGPLDPYDRDALKNLVRLALVTDEGNQDLVFERFAELATTDDEPVAFALVSALASLGLRPGMLAAFRPVLDALAAHPSEMVREEAGALREAYTRYLLGE